MPAGPWTGSAGAGLAFTGGNTDTSTVNVSYDLTYDPKTKNLAKSDALYLPAKKNVELTLNRLGPSTALAVDGGLGAVCEKNPGLDLETSGALTASEHLTQKLSDTTSVTQQIAGLWKMADIGNALYDPFWVRRQGRRSSAWAR